MKIKLFLAELWVNRYGIAVLIGMEVYLWVAVEYGWLK